MRRHHFYSCKLFKIAKFHEVQNKSKCLYFNIFINAVALSLQIYTEKLKEQVLNLLF